MISPATWLVWATVVLILVLFWGGYLIARASGHFDDFEEVKFKVFEEKPDDELQ